MSIPHAYYHPHMKLTVFAANSALAVAYSPAQKLLLKQKSNHPHMKDLIKIFQYIFIYMDERNMQEKS